MSHDAALLDVIAMKDAELARLRGENDRMRAAMAEAVRDYHGIAVLFSSRFLALAQEPPA